MSNAEYDKDLADLRKIYVEALPRQRYSIAQQRIKYPEHGPNVLVACVSAVEGLARSLAMHRHTRGNSDMSTIKAKLSSIYPDYKRKGAKELIEEFLSGAKLPPPASLFGESIWETFLYAVEYRNVLAHECTYLGQDRSPALIQACQTVLHKLAASAGLKAADA
jgi:hypothetical protein